MRIIIMLIAFVVFSDDKSHRKILIEKFGTTIIFATGTDGIIMAADSRQTTYYDIAQKKISSQIDSTQKIFLLKGYPMAVAGLYSYGNKEMFQIVNDFNAINLPYKDMTEVFGSFINYMNTYYPVYKYPLSHQTDFYCVGYVGDSAYLIAKRKDKSDFSAWDSCGSNAKGADSIFIKKYKRISCNELAKLAEQTIITYYTKLKKTTTGGPISIVKISKDNKAVFIKNDFSVRPLGGIPKSFPPN